MTHSKIPAKTNDNNKQAARCRKWVVSDDAIVNHFMLVLASRRILEQTTD